MKLLVVESPSKAKTIGKYLGKGYKVLSSYGHVRGLPSAAGAVSPERDFEMQYEVQDRSKKHINDIVKNAKQSEEILLATDPDREGEAISWHISELLKQHNSKLVGEDKTKRIVFYEITRDSIKRALKEPRSINMNLVHAQQARQALDYLVGFTLSPILWRKLPGSRSAGRVQSVALRLVCERESEIEQFKSEEYWSIRGNFSDTKAQAFDANLYYYKEKLEKLSIKNEEQVKQIIEAASKLSYTITKVEKKQRKRNPSPPFTTSTMLQEASKKYGFSAKRTAQVAQSLYEGVEIEGDLKGLITYMRTDSVTISKEAQEAIASMVLNSYGNKYLPSRKWQYRTKTKNAQEAHEAIRPTDINLKPWEIKPYLKPEQYKLYDLIWKRTVASQMSSVIFDVITAEIESTNQVVKFRATGSKIAFDGYYKVYEESEEEAKEEQGQYLPDLLEGDNVNLLELTPSQHFTQPPPRYTEASLVKKMEEVGVGRPSTYPSIISIIQEREYVELVNKRFIPKPRGRTVNAFLTTFFTRYVQYDFTANLEDTLDDISNGVKYWKELLSEFWGPFHTKAEEVGQLKNTDIIKEIEKLLLNSFVGEDHSCPECETGQLELKVGKFGAFIGCSNYPECRHNKPLAPVTESQGGAEEPKANSLPKVLGANPDSGSEVSLKKGPYGFYVQEGEGKEAKRAGLPKGVNVENVDLDYAVKLLKLPMVIGEHPETGSPIKAGNGRFGPYVHCNNKYYSIGKLDPLQITLEEALEIIAKGGNKKKSASRTTKKKG